MFDLGKCILVTNNDRAAEKWGENVEQVVMVETYEEVLLKTRDLIHTNHKLLTHPQASSLKPNQTPIGPSFYTVKPEKVMQGISV